MAIFWVVNAFLINAIRQMWLLRLSAQKRIFPMELDIRAGGQMESEESYQSAFRHGIY